MRTRTVALLSAAVFLALGGFVVVTASGYPLGTASAMGPGYVPLLLGLALAVLAVRQSISGFSEEGSCEAVPWRGLIFVMVGISVFAVLIERAGLVPALMAGAAATALADPGSRPLPVLILSIATGAGGWLVFTLILGLAVPPIRSPL